MKLPKRVFCFNDLMILQMIGNKYNEYKKYEQKQGYHPFKTVPFLFDISDGLAPSRI